MASEGECIFAGIDSATTFINTILVKNIRSIQLHWSDIRVDPYTSALAGMSANWQEELTDMAGKTTSASGYFTGTAEKTPGGWQLRNAHWSEKKEK
jgi:hypothetical protein